MRSRPLPLIAALLARALLVLAVMAGLAAMHTLVASQLGIGGGQAVMQQAQRQVAGDAGDLVVSQGAPGPMQDSLMDVLAACLAVLLAAVAIVARPIGGARGPRAGPTTTGALPLRALIRPGPRIDLSGVLRI